MSFLEQLAEARIRDWIRRGRPRPEGISDDLSGSTLESQLLAEIVALRQSARAEDDAQARAGLLEESRKRETQLFVLLEKTGRPLAARALAERIHKL